MVYYSQTTFMPKNTRATRTGDFRTKKAHTAEHSGASPPQAQGPAGACAFRRRTRNVCDGAGVRTVCACRPRSATPSISTSRSPTSTRPSAGEPGVAAVTRLGFGFWFWFWFGFGLANLTLTLHLTWGDGRLTLTLTLT